MKRILLTKVFFLSFTVVFAANRFWVGTPGNNIWSNPGNWATTSGGAGGAGVPTGADVAIFTGAANNDCNIDVTVGILGLTVQNTFTANIFQNGNNIVVGTTGVNMAAGVYIGTTGNFTTSNVTINGAAFTVGSGNFTATGNFTMTNAGIFTASTGRVSIGGTYTLTNGTFTASSDSTFFGGNLVVNAAGTDPSPAIFLHNNGTAVFNSTTNRSANINGPLSGNLDFFDLVLAMRTTAPNILTIATNDIFNVFHHGALVSGQLTGPNSNIQVVDNADLDVSSTFGGSNVPLIFINVGTGSNNFRLDAPYSTRLGGNVIVQKNPGDSVHIRSLTPGGTITDGFNNTSVFVNFSGVIDYPDNNRVVLNFTQTIILPGATFISTSDSLFQNGDYVNSTGTFLHNNGTYVFSGNQSRVLQFDPNTTETFFNFVLNKPAVNNNLTLDPGDTSLVVENNLVIENGELIAAGGPNTAGFKLNGNFTGDAGMSATTVQLQFTGTGDQTITMDPAVTGNWDGNIIIIKPAVSNVTLNTPFILDAGPNQVLTFAQGIIQSTATNLLTLGDNNTVTGANNNSYTTGPVQKIGTNFFEFPLGASNFYAPIRVTGGINGTDDLGGASTFQAEYLKVNPDALFPIASREDPPLTNVSACEYWILSKDAISPGAFVWLGYDNTRSCGVTDPTLLRVARWDGSVWRDEGNGNLVPTPLVATANAQTNFGLPFTLASLDATANSLPVTLTEFSAQQKDDLVEVKWTTETEINNKFFDIERSTDGSHFTSIGKVDGAGNTTLIQHYSLLDPNPANGINYYRLKQVDFDGKFTYSKVVAVNVTRMNVALKIYPNPAISNITAEYKGFINTKVNIQLVDNYGRIVMSSVQQPGASGRINLQLNNNVKTAGTYWLKMTTDKETLQQKVVIGQQ